MEVLNLGPRRRRNGRQQLNGIPMLDPLELDPLELGTEPAVDEPEGLAVGYAGDVEDEHDAAERWLAGLVRADVLAVSAAIMAGVAIFGLPFSETLNMITLYGPERASTTWLFAPVLIMLAAALALGLGALRQAARERATRWVRITAGVATLVSALLWLGTAAAWWYTAHSDVLGRMYG